jgi:outer membrane protein assembly factor BamE
MIRHQLVLRIILAPIHEDVITHACPQGLDALAFSLTIHSAIKGATTVPLTDQSITLKDCQQGTRLGQQAPIQFATRLARAMGLILLGASLGLLGACSSMKAFNPIPERWRGDSTEKADQPPDIGARSRLQSLFSPYRTTVQQGNYITQDQLERVRAGMTRNQLQFVLGQPLLGNSFRDDRWVYVFRMQWPDLRHDTRRVTVFFDEQQRVVRVESDTLPQTDDGKDPAVPGYRPPRGNDR